jgi:hypothetical protein
VSTNGRKLRQLDSCRVLWAKINKGMYRNNKTCLAGRVWSVVVVGSISSDGFSSSSSSSFLSFSFFLSFFFEIENVVNFDSFNLLNLAGEDLWSSGVHVKKTRVKLIRSLYKPPHGRGGITLGQLQQGRKRQVKILTCGPIRRQPIRNYGTKKNNSRVEGENKRVTFAVLVSQGLAAETGHGKVVKC